MAGFPYLHSRRAKRRVEAPGAARAVVVAMALAALVAAGCGGAPPPGTPAQIVKKAIAAQAELKSVAMELDSELELDIPGSRRSAVVTYRGVYQKPDRWHLDVRVSGARSEVIILGDRTFVKLPGADVWTEKKGDMLNTGAPAGDLLGSEYLASASDVRLISKKGDDYHLGFDLDMASFARSFSMGGVDPSLLKGRKARMEIWVLKDSLNVRKATMSFSGDLAEAGPGTLKMVMEVQFSEFNEPVSIEPPTL